MKHTIILLAFIALSFASYSQTIRKDAKGNYYAVKDTATTGATKTGKTFTDADNKVHDVYISKKGKLFYYRISKTTGKKYPFYLKLN